MKLVIELKVLPIDKKGVGVTTYHEAARSLRSLARWFESEAPGAELALHNAHGSVIDHDDPDGRKQVGSWKVVRR